MSEKKTIDCYEFEDEVVFERAKKEYNVIKEIHKRYFPMEPKNAIKLYRKAVKEKLFSTVVGYSFLNELLEIIRNDNESVVDALPKIVVKEKIKPTDVQNLDNKKVPLKDSSKKYKGMYEWQRFVNKRLKIVIAGLIIIIIAFVTIELKSEYSVLTYFTDYKSKMENELVNKYESWESELQQREDALNQAEAQNK